MRHPSPDDDEIDGLIVMFHQTLPYQDLMYLAFDDLDESLDLLVVVLSGYDSL